MASISRWRPAAGWPKAGGAVFDGDAVNTAISEANLITFRTPDYQLSSAQDFRPGKPGYQQHPWQASLDPDAVVFTSHPGTDNESGEHTARPNFWAGNRWLPRVGQQRNVAVIIHHVPADDPRPYSHAYFPRAAFDEVVQADHWVFGRKGSGYIALYSQRAARWAEDGAYAGIELRADAPDNIWICEMGSAAGSGSFAAFMSAVQSAPVQCEGLAVRYQSPSLGEVRFGWTGPLPGPFRNGDPLRRRAGGARPAGLWRAAAGRHAGLCGRSGDPVLSGLPAGPPVV
jgi:hypothetical protein